MSSKPTVTINIDLDYKFPPSTNGDKRLSPQEATANYLEAAVASAHPQGLEGQQRRVWGRIQRTLDAALDAKAKDIEIEQAGLEFLKKALRECKIPPSLSKYFIVLEDEIDREREA